MAEKLPRRGFIKVINGFLATLGLTALVGPVIAYFWPAKLEEVPSEPVSLGAPDSIAVGEAKTVRFGRYPAIVINTPEKGLVAYSAVCTHFACIVKWNQADGVLECPCHAGYFDPLDGSVISGPPPSPLEAVRVFTEGGTLYIGGEA